MKGLRDRRCAVEGTTLAKNIISDYTLHIQVASKRTSDSCGIVNEGIPVWPKLPKPAFEAHIASDTSSSSCARSLTLYDELDDANLFTREFMVDRRAKDGRDVS